MWEGITDPQTKTVETAGDFSLDARLPTTKIRKLRVSSSNITAIRGNITVYIEEKGAYHPLVARLPIMPTDAVAAFIDSNFVPERNIRSIFEGAQVGDVCHMFITYEIWRPD